MRLVKPSFNSIALWEQSQVGRALTSDWFIVVVQGRMVRLHMQDLVITVMATSLATVDRHLLLRLMYNLSIPNYYYLLRAGALTRTAVSS